ncbi:hypothetical protein [Xanthomonas sp. MUS 060]|uniref:hypothetical protein n=1 Tax=Xanthomonas sp. MUS 060 TaxID=1588031 RepID=UPI0005F2CB70|nr:hypothetical protein [Xanthomonas sp. MUS 060]
MSWALAALGLAEDADERAIKRAYAARLKVTRPDDDPTGFQQLHKTYQAALEWSRQLTATPRAAEHTADDRRADGDAAQATDASTPHTLSQWGAPAAARPGDAAPPASYTSQADSTTRTVTAEWIAPPATDIPSIDLAQTQRRLLDHAQRLEPEPLHAWLLAQPELWSLENKPQIGTCLQHHLLEHDEALSTYHYAVLAKFFDWEQALDAPDPYLVQRACARMHLRWLLQPTGHLELSAALKRRGDSAASVVHVRKLLALLGHATSSDGGMSAAMLWPGRPTRVRRLLDLIGYVPDGRKPPPPLNRESANAWYMAGEKRMFNPIAAMIGVARSLIAAAVFLLLCLLLAMIDHNPTDGMSPILKVGFYGAPIIVGAWVAWDGFIALLRWQSRHEADPWVSHPLLQRFFIPTITAVAAALITTGHSYVATAIALPLLVIALARWVRRSSQQFQLNWKWSWMWPGLIGLKLGSMAVSLLIVYPQATLGATAITWLGDLIWQWNVRKKLMR